MTGPDVTVVGGGITGLAAAWELARGGARVTVLEASPRLGGKIVSDEFRGRPIDLGPDAFLARLPDAVQLCRELGLKDQLVGVATDMAFIWVRGRLRPLPGGTVLGAPAGVGALAGMARSGVVSPAGVARATLDLVLPASDLGSDPSVGDIVTARFGREVHERLVDPLVGGIHAGSSSELSAEAAAPQLAAGAREERSLLLGLRRLRRTTPGPAVPGPTFVSLVGGLGTLVARLERSLIDAGVRIELERMVHQIPFPGTGTTILTTPAPVTAALVEKSSPTAAAELAAVEHASVALAVMSYPITALPGGRPLRGSGFLVPQREGKLMTACSFASSKWPHMAAPDEVLFRVSAGRWSDDRAGAMDDAELLSCLHRELTQILGLRREPLAGRVTRWPEAFPQYRPGHLRRVARIEAALHRDIPRVLVAGAAFRGVGIPACIAQGRAAGRRALGL